MDVKSGYKRTEIGAIPTEWELMALVELAEIRSGIAKNSNASISNPVLVHYLRVANVQDGYLDLTQMSQLMVSREDIKRYAVLPGDMLMNEGGDLDKLGRGALWRGEFSPCVHQNHVFVVRCGGSLLPGYLKTWTGSASARRYFLFAGRQTTNLASINKTSLGRLPIPLPSTKPEQEAIAEALSDADALIESLEQLLAKKRHIKQGAMQELLTGKKRLPGFSGEWEVKRLGDLIEKFVGGGTPSRSNQQYWGGNIPWVTVKDFATFNPYQAQETITKAGLQNSASHLIAAGTVITSTRMALGKAVLYDVDVAINQDLKALFPKPELSPHYLLLWFQYHGPAIDEIGSGSTVKGIALADLKKLELHVPSPLEQTAIAAIFSDMAAEIAALKAKIAKSRQLKQGMMQELLTGKIRLVKPKQQVDRLPVRQTSVQNPTTSHNWQINEAVVISVLAKNFGSEQWPLGRKRYTKLSYLLHRHVEGQAEGYLKKAAGPYNPATKYKGPEEIALKNGYVRRHTRDKFSGLVAAGTIAAAERYFAKWYGTDVLAWLNQFRHKSNDELELLATVDMAMVDLHKKNKAVQLANVKQVIRNHPEWEAKLDRAIFSDDSISWAMKTCRQLFASTGSN